MNARSSYRPCDAQNVSTSGLNAAPEIFDRPTRQVQGSPGKFNPFAQFDAVLHRPGAVDWASIDT
jgi:hypothetical protein